MGCKGLQECNSTCGKEGRWDEQKRISAGQEIARGWRQNPPEVKEDKQKFKCRTWGLYHLFLKKTLVSGVGKTLVLTGWALVLRSLQFLNMYSDIFCWRREGDDIHWGFRRKEAGIKKWCISNDIRGKEGWGNRGSLLHNLRKIMCPCQAPGWS